MPPSPSGEKARELGELAAVLGLPGTVDFKANKADKSLSPTDLGPWAKLVSPQTQATIGVLDVATARTGDALGTPHSGGQVVERGAAFDSGTFTAGR